VYNIYGECSLAQLEKNGDKLDKILAMLQLMLNPFFGKKIQVRRKIHKKQQFEFEFEFVY